MRYRVICGNYLLLDTQIESLKLIDPTLELELNKTGSFTFMIYPDHPNYDKIQKLKPIITVYQDEIILFRGRILKLDGITKGRSLVKVNLPFYLIQCSARLYFLFPIPLRQRPKRTCVFCLQITMNRLMKNINLSSAM